MQDHRNPKLSRVLNHSDPKNTEEEEEEEHRNTKPRIGEVDVLTQDQRDTLPKGNPGIIVTSHKFADRRYRYTK